MIDCQQMRERLESIALASPQAALDADIIQHLDACDECQRELHELQAAWLLLPASLPQPAVGQQMEDVLLDRIRSAPNSNSVSLSTAVFWKYAVAASVFFVMGALSLYGLGRIGRGPEQVTNKDIDSIKSVAQQLDKLEELERVFAAPQLRYVSLTSSTSKLQGYLVHDPVSRQAHFFGYGLRPNNGKTYHLWLLNSRGQVVSNSEIETAEDRNIGTATIDLPPNRTTTHELVVSAEESMDPTSPSDIVWLRTRVEN